ncbi:hypothetical protein HD806DRAFT_499593 [Xylariaceae sp. AK1471]|nr:hypothetical protein HD806DRAFT_499593 [Xylariaceae sp. AK1471]
MKRRGFWIFYFYWHTGVHTLHGVKEWQSYLSERFWTFYKPLHDWWVFKNGNREAFGLIFMFVKVSLHQTRRKDRVL